MLARNDTKEPVHVGILLLALFRSRHVSGAAVSIMDPYALGIGQIDGAGTVELVVFAIGFHQGIDRVSFVEAFQACGVGGVGSER